MKKGLGSANSTHKGILVLYIYIYIYIRKYRPMLKTRHALQLAQKRGFILPAIAALTGSNYFKHIQQANEFENVSNNKSTSSLSSIFDLESYRPTYTPARRFPDGRIDISGTERFILAAISGVQSFRHPEIGFNVNNFGEATAFDFILKNLRNRMLETPDGRDVLKDRPLMNTKTLDPEYLKTLPEESLGYQYWAFTMTGDERAAVRFIADEELAYVFLRYRQIHDITHILTKQKTDLAGELVVKAFEFGNTQLPMTGVACSAYVKLSEKRKQKVFMVDTFLNGLHTRPLVGVYWERLMERNVDDIRKELGIITDFKSRYTANQ